MIQEQQATGSRRHNSLKCVKIKQRQNHASVCLSVCSFLCQAVSLPVCLCVNIEAAVFGQTPSQLIHQRWSRTRSASSSVDTHLCSSAGTRALGIARSNPVHDLFCCSSSLHFSSHSPLLSVGLTPAAIFKDVVMTQEYVAGRLKIGRQIAPEEHAIECDWVQCPPQLQFKMKGFEGCWGMQFQ